MARVCRCLYVYDDNDQFVVNILLYYQIQDRCSANQHVVEFYAWFLVRFEQVLLVILFLEYHELLSVLDIYFDSCRSNSRSFDIHSYECYDSEFKCPNL